MERRSIIVRGVVQGVGFRPFVHGLASRLDLSGFVRNQSGLVQIEVEGEASSLDWFLFELSKRPPPLAHIDRLTWEPRPTVGEGHFDIERSDCEMTGTVYVCSDVATCGDCLRELFDPMDRRYQYPFLNCTNCGPRISIVTSAPYDRQRTTMAGFPMCDACRAEYEDPGNRRFHAQPTACKACGPRIAGLDRRGHGIETNDPLEWFVAGLRAGQIGAMKGLGGYHLVCDARDVKAVAELRHRKQRDEKPFAIMVRDLESAETLCEIQPSERELLLSPRRPIVILRKRGSTSVVEAVSPGNPSLGVMLPYTPLHQLLLQKMNGSALVMTSGNGSDEPIAFLDEDALNRLGHIADRFLTHDRPINVRSDDSVTRVIAGSESPVRRSRGYAPHPIPLPVECSLPILAVGGQMKVTFALGRERDAFVGHHMGDLDHVGAYRAFEKDIALYEQLFEVHPQRIAHDLHPDYASTRYATKRGADGVDLIPVQHHHAHMASCMAENGLIEPVIGVTFDGTGFGTDGTIWGGEFLVGDYHCFRRAAHLRYVGMPGGERAVREPWRMAVAYLTDAGYGTGLMQGRIPPVALRTVNKMIEREFNSSMTSSAGRLFDAVASLAGARDVVSFEGQAAMQLEWLATGVPADGCYPFALMEIPAAPLIIDTRPLIRAVAQEVNSLIDASKIARRFHSTIVEIIAAVCARLRCNVGLDAVVLSGGVFMNALLTTDVLARLRVDGFRVYRHHLVPSNDGGLSLGQLAIAAATPPAYLT